MATCNSLADIQQPPSMCWIYPELLPLGELVFLDGATGAGKSAFVAHLAAYASQQQYREGVKHVLYFSSPLQRPLRDHQLFTQQAMLENIHEIQYNPEPYLEQVRDLDIDKHLVFDLLNQIEEALEQDKPSLVVIDSLEEILGRSADPNYNIWKYLFQTLLQFASKHRCTFLIPRLHGTHEARHYGPAARLGTELARHIVSLHWHPHDATKRVLTLAKSYRHVMGQQWHLQFDENGKIEVEHKLPYEHVRPARTPQTWMPDPEHLHQTREIYAKVEEKMDGQPIRKQELRDYIVVELEYSEKAFLRTMSKAKLDSYREGVEWYYRPACQYQCEIMQPKEAARTPAAEMEEQAEAASSDRREAA